MRLFESICAQLLDVVPGQHSAERPIRVVEKRRIVITAKRSTKIVHEVLQNAGFPSRRYRGMQAQQFLHQRLARPRHAGNNDGGCIRVAYFADRNIAIT